MRRLSTSPLRIAGVLALVALLSGSAFAEGSERSPTFPPGLAEARLIKEMPKEIGMGEETLKKLEKLVAEIRAKDEELLGKTVEARKALQALLDQSRPDEKELMAAVGAAQDVARVMTGDTLMGQHSTTLHFGLGAETRVEAIEVRWVSGASRRLADPAIDRYHEIRGREITSLRVDAHRRTEP